MKLITKAQVQELATYTAIEKEDKHELVAKLSRGTYDAYKNAQSVLGSERDASVTTYKQFLELKELVWEALMHIYAGCYMNQEQQNGEALAFVRYGKKMLPQVEKSSNVYQKNNSTKDVTKEQYNFVVFCANRFDEKYTKENTMVYHSKVPDQVPELPVEAQSIGKAVAFEYPKAHQLWTADVYDKFNLPQAPPQENKQAPAFKPLMPTEKVENEKKRERESPSDLEENVRKSTRYDSGGVSLCSIM
jgi:hypothetical protein